MAWLGGVADINARWQFIDPEKNIFGLVWENMIFYLPQALGDLNANQELAQNPGHLRLPIFNF